MKIIHLPVSFLPWHTGGKEVFVYNLAKELNNKGIQNHILIHADNTGIVSEGVYEYNGLPVTVLPSLKKNYINQWDREINEAKGFESFLLQEKPDIIHFHDQNEGASLTHLRIVKKLRIKSVLTFHSPGQSCPQRSLLYKGRYVCNGKLDLYKCSRCLLSCRGILEPITSLMAFLNFEIGDYETNKLNRVTAQRNLVEIWSKAFKEIYSLHDKIQIHALWCKDLLLFNGVEKEKIFFTRQGVPNKNYSIIGKNKEEKIKLIFIGRCEWVKGVHILIDAVKMLPLNIPIEVYFLGPYWDSSKYGKAQIKKIEGDNRFTKPRLLPPSDIGDFMQQMDACIIPSLWPETGPLVLLEAFQAGLPVIGSNFAGIAENIVDGKDGLLFERGNTMELFIILMGLSKMKLLNMKSEIRPVRGISEMSEDIVKMYKSLIPEA